MTIKNWYLIPLIPELINQLWGEKYITKLDVWWGYDNVRIQEGDEWKAAFRTNQGLFNTLVMFEQIVQFKKDFSACLEITDLGEIHHHILGIHITCDWNFTPSLLIRQPDLGCRIILPSTPTYWEGETFILTIAQNRQQTAWDFKHVQRSQLSWGCWLTLICFPNSP